MVDILKNIMNIAYRVRDMQIAGTLSMALFGVVLVFGIMNCVLGYRLLRFWMMIFGFLIGAGIGLFAIHQIGFGEKMYYAVGMIGVGLVLAILSFAVFKAGIFIMGAGIGLTITVYIIHPTTSFSFFICLLAGVGLGMLALRYEREVIIVGTSILGGILSGFSTAKLAKMEEIPFGIIFSIGFALVGMLIQFAINKPKYDDDYDDEEDEDQGKVPERRQKWEEADWEEAESETKRRGKKERDDKKNPSREQYRKYQEEYEDDDLDDDLSDADDKEIDEILDEYGVDEEDVIEEYLEDYYGENKRKPQKRQKSKNKRKNSASPYQKNR